MTEFYQIYYEDDQLKKMYPFATPYYNERLTIFFENDPIVKLVMRTKADKISVTSWKLIEKMRWYIGRPRPLTQEILESDYDVLSFTKNSKHHHMLAAAEKWHKGFRATMQRILDVLMIKMPGEVKNPIYQNHFSAKREIYQDYVKNYLNPAMEVMNNVEEINKLVMADSNYSKLDRASPEKLKSIEEKIGIGYYPMAPFILERLFSIYVHNNKINVSWL